MIFLKKKIMEIPHADNFFMKHLLIGLLISYKKLRSKVEFHGFINHNSVIGTEEDGARKFSLRQSIGSNDVSEINRLQQEFITYKYQLTYHHLNMVTVSDWLRLKRLKLESGSK